MILGKILPKLFDACFVTQYYLPDSGSTTEPPPPSSKPNLSLEAQGWWVHPDGRVLPPAPPPRSKKIF